MLPPIQNVPDLAKVMGRLSNSPPPKSAHDQDKGWGSPCEWPGWAIVEIPSTREWQRSQSLGTALRAAYKEGSGSV